MNKITKVLSVIFLGFCISLGVFGEWNATIYVDVTHGEDDCSPNAYIGDIICQINSPGGDSETQDWKGYDTYTFYLDAPNSGSLSAIANLNNGSEPPTSFCYDSDTYYWETPPVPAIVDIELIPEILD
jgi:hypothetical protein